jgi:hypothetical protein
LLLAASASTMLDMSMAGSVTAVVPAIPNRTNGHAATLEEAMAKFRDAWTKTKARARL